MLTLVATVHLLQGVVLCLILSTELSNRNLGKWILTKNFIEDSIEAGKWLDEEAYEWSNQSNIAGVSSSHLSAPGRWRKILQTQRGPFEGWKVLVVVTDAKKRAAYKR